MQEYNLRLVLCHQPEKPSLFPRLPDHPESAFPQDGGNTLAYQSVGMGHNDRVFRLDVVRCPAIRAVHGKIIARATLVDGAVMISAGHRADGQVGEPSMRCETACQPIPPWPTAVIGLVRSVGLLHPKWYALSGIDKVEKP